MATSNETATPAATGSKPAADGSVVANIKLNLETKEKAQWIMGLKDTSMAQILRDALADYIVKHNPQGKRYAG